LSINIGGRNLPAKTSVYCYGPRKTDRNGRDISASRSADGQIYNETILGYLASAEKECEVLKRRIEWRKDDPTCDIKPVITMEQL